MSDQSPLTQRTRIKLRVSDGRTTIAEFAASATLSDVRQHIASTLHLSSQSTQISQSSPARTLGSDLDTQSLTALGLCPTATLLVCDWEARKPVSTVNAAATSANHAAAGDDEIAADSWNLMSSAAYMRIYAALVAAMVLALALFLSGDTKPLR
ncbi:hypothetical protein LPJ73_001964 [Coemansia sp. RSA 2703]|nr:hypothetical protein LPJ73_001964 [Coemansia sp. RSA 2703]KAJ2373943.1 hypothetical protein IW150_003361 [Coemansia sp. RSA 2607]